MQNLNNLVLKARNETLKVYRLSPARIKQDRNIEQENMDGYAGREILELLQNAVDQLGGDSSSTIKIQLVNNILSISNTGKPFSFDGIQSIMVSNNSPKQNNDIYIGNKGLGFRSVLNWSSIIRIFSEGLSVEFSRQISKNFFKANDIEIDVATLVAPEPIESRDLGDYVTLIELVLTNNVLEDVKRQLSLIKSETLLFLDNVETVIISVDEKTRQFSRVHNNQKVHVECNDDGIVVSKDYQLFEDVGTMPYTDTDGKLSTRKYKIAVAYDDSIDTKDNRIYNFFATKINIPIKWHVHATFELTSDRNTIIENVANETLLEKLCILLSKSAELLDTDSRWGKLESVLPDGDFPLPMNIGGIEFYDVYLSEIISAKILPLYGGGFISIEDKPALLNNELHEFVTPINNLLEYAPEQKFDEFIQNNAETHKPNFRLVCKNLKSRLADISIDDRATCIVRLSAEYDHLTKDDFLKNAPNIFIDDNSNSIANGNVYLSPQEKISALPNFVRIKTMSTLLQNILAKKLGVNSARPLMNALSSYNVHEYSLRPIIEKINSTLKKKYSAENYRAYINWIFENRELLTADIPVLLIAQDGTLQKSDILYFTNDYSVIAKNNQLIYSANRLVADFKDFGVNADDKDDFINFLRDRDIAETPRDIRKTVHDIEDDYIKLVVENFDGYPIDNDRIRQYKNHDIRDVNDLKQYFKIRNTIEKSYTIDGFENLFKLTTTEIITTLLNIPELLEQYDKEATISYRDLFPYSASDRQLRNRIYSYTLYKLQTTPWILINKKKYSPSEIILYSGIGEKVDGLVGVSRDDIFKKSSIEEDERDALIRKLGIAKDFSELPDEMLYRILLQAPDFDKEGRASKKIYSDIAKGKSSSPSNNDAKAIFIEKGKLFTRAGNFVPVQDVVYTYKVTPKQLENHYNLLGLPAKQGEKKISDWLGVGSINLDVIAVGLQKTHNLNDEFQEYEMPKNRSAILAIKWEDYTTDKDRNKVKNIQIHLVEALKVRINSEEELIELTDYGIAVDAKIKNKYYIKVPVTEGDIRKLRSETLFANSVMEIFSQQLLLNDEEFTQFGARAVAADLQNTRLLYGDNLNFNEAERYLQGKMIEDETDFVYENQRKLVRTQNNFRDHYRKALYVQLEKDLDNQNKWSKLLNEYIDYSPTDDDTIPNERDFDALNYIKNMFPILKIDISNVDVDNLYETTVKNLNKEFLAEYSEQLDRFYITHEYLLRFGRYDEAVNEFRRLHIMTDIDSPTSDEDLKSISDMSDTEIHTVSTLTPALPKNNGNANSKHAVSTGHIDRQNAKRKANGLIAEELVYEKLNEEYGSDNVRWLSGFAKEKEINVGEAGDGLGYDFKITVDENVQYIEVKSGTGKLGKNITFKMSANEYNFAIRNKEQYRVLYVANGIIYDVDFVFNLGHYIKVPDSYDITIGLEQS